MIEKYFEIRKNRNYQLSEHINLVKQWFDLLSNIVFV